MSRITVISRPADWSERTAASRPAPGPLMNTSTRRRPRSWASFAAASAETCAANGVFFRDPLKPFRPADDQAMTFPYVSVSVTITLLNVALTNALPFVSTWTFFFFFVTGAAVACFANRVLLTDFGCGGTGPWPVAPQATSSRAPSSFRRPSSSSLCACVHSCGSVVPGPEGLSGDAVHGNTRCPSIA